MKTKLLFLISFFLFVLLDIKAQSSITEYVTLVTSNVCIEKITSKAGQVSYNYSAYGLGRLFPTADSSSAISRSYFDFSLSQIPTTATIQEVRVDYSTGGINNSFKITKLSSINPNDLGACWSAIGNGTVKDQGIAYGNGSFFSSGIKSEMQSALSSRKLILGALSHDETSNNSYATVSFTLYVKYTRPAENLTFVAKNDLKGDNGGSIGVGVNEAPTSRPSPYAFTAYENQTVNLQAYDNQNINGKIAIFNNTEAPNNKSRWERRIGEDNTYLGQSQSTSFIADKDFAGASYVAGLKEVYNLTFSNQLSGTSQTGTMQVNGVNYSAPTSAFPVVEQNNISVAAQYTYDFGGSLFYEFSNWSDGLTQTNRTISASQTQNLTAVYKRVPKFSEGLYRNLTYSFPYHANLRLSWSEHPDTNVKQYQIWQKIKKINGVNQPQIPQLVTTVNRGITSYTFPNFQQLQGVDLYEVYFDVKAYYAPDGTTSWDDWILVSAWSNQQDKVNGENTEEPQIIKEYSISNYPNPFNPTTNIEYAIKEDGFVTIKVFDILGNEIAELVNEQKTVGRYTTEFNAASAAGLPSGVYLYSIQVNNAKGGSTFRSTKKMILAK